jgi:hypothetical protein
MSEPMVTVEISVNENNQDLIDVSEYLSKVSAEQIGEMKFRITYPRRIENRKLLVKIFQYLLLTFKVGFESKINEFEAEQSKQAQKSVDYAR